MSHSLAQHSYLTSICPIRGGPTEHLARMDPIFTDAGTCDDGCPQTCNLFSCVVIHVSAHLANAANFSTSYSEEFPALNVARYRGEVRLMKPFIFYLGLHVGFQAVGSNDKICWLRVSCFFPGPQMDHLDHEWDSFLFPRQHFIWKNDIGIVRGLSLKIEVCRNITVRKWCHTCPLSLTCLCSVPGVTGIVLVLILFLMLMSSSNCVR